MSERRNPAPGRVRGKATAGHDLTPVRPLQNAKDASSSLLRDLVTPVLCAERLLLQLWPTSKLLESREQFWPMRSD